MAWTAEQTEAVKAKVTNVVKNTRLQFWSGLVRVKKVAGTDLGGLIAGELGKIEAEFNIYADSLQKNLHYLIETHANPPAPAPGESTTSAPAVTFAPDALPVDLAELP